MSKIQLDHEKMAAVLDRIGGGLAQNYRENAVTVGEAGGVVYRIVAMNAMFAEDLGCGEAPPWAQCVGSEA